MINTSNNSSNTWDAGQQLHQRDDAPRHLHLGREYIFDVISTLKHYNDQTLESNDIRLYHYDSMYHSIILDYIIMMLFRRPNIEIHHSC